MREARVVGCRASSIAPVRRCGKPLETEMDIHFVRRASPAIFALDSPKPPLRSFTRSRTRPYRKALQASRTGKPGGIESPQDGLRRLLPEPTPSPRLSPPHQPPPPPSCATTP